jgi:hypothetical protein
MTSLLTTTNNNKHKTMSGISLKTTHCPITTNSIMSVLADYYAPVEFYVDPYKFCLEQHLHDFSTDFWTLHTTNEDNVFHVHPSSNEIGQRIWTYLQMEAPNGYIHIWKQPSGVCIRSSGGTPFEFMCLLRDWLHCVQRVPTSTLAFIDDDDDDDDDENDNNNKFVGSPKIPTLPVMSEQSIQTFREWITGVMLEPVAFKIFHPEYRSKSPAEFGFTMFCRQMTELFQNIKRNGSTEGGYSMRNITDPFVSLILTGGRDMMELWDHKDIRLYPMHARHGDDIVSYRFVQYLRQYLCWYGLKCSDTVL